MTTEFIERRIITGLIVSTEFTSAIRSIWKMEYLEASGARLVADWCIAYYDKYRKAPNTEIKSIYMERLRRGLRQELAESVEVVLDGLSTEYNAENFNVDYLTAETKEYFRVRRLTLHKEDIEAALISDSVQEAEAIASGFNILIEESNTTVEPFSDMEATRKAFESAATPLFTFPKRIGVLNDYWGDQFVRDGFLALMGPEKIGKTFMLMDLAMRAYKGNCNVALFQAGDMSESQQIRRLGIYLAKKSDRKKYCKELLIPTLDCELNQYDECERPERECDVGVFERSDTINLEVLEAAVKANTEYQPCRNCYKVRHNGQLWYTIRPPIEPLIWKEAYTRFRRFRQKYDKKFKLVTYPNEALTVAEITSILETWRNNEGFVPDVILIDYADILGSDPDTLRFDKREQINKIWQRLRRLSQELHCLIITATQAAASSYDKKSLRLSDFSEDKRKYSHVTSMYGLSQEMEEKKLGIMRIGELVLREGDFDRSNEVKVLQRLQIGRPVLDSYW